MTCEINESREHVGCRDKRNERALVELSLAVAQSIEQGLKPVCETDQHGVAEGAGTRLHRMNSPENGVESLDVAGKSGERPEAFLDGRVFKSAYQPLATASAKRASADRIVDLLGDVATLADIPARRSRFTCCA